MAQEAEVHVEQKEKRSVSQLLQVQDRNTLFWTLISVAAGVAFFVVLSIPPEPYVMVDLFKLGLWPALAVISTAGAIRGPLAGLLTGYLGALLYGLLFFGTVVTVSLNPLAFGVMGFVVGLVRYDFGNGRSLAKLSLMSVIGFVFTMLVTIVVGLTVEVYADLVALGFVLLPLLTVGVPTVFLLTPLFSWVWQSLVSRIPPARRV